MHHLRSLPRAFRFTMYVYNRAHYVARSAMPQQPALSTDESSPRAQVAVSDVQSGTGRRGA